jgi:hypothetical protein
MLTLILVNGQQFPHTNISENLLYSMLQMCPDMKNTSRKQMSVMKWQAIIHIMERRDIQIKVQQIIQDQD